MISESIWICFEDDITVIFPIPFWIYLGHKFFELKRRFLIISSLHRLVVTLIFKPYLKVRLLQDCLQSLCLEFRLLVPHFNAFILLPVLEETL